ncbi:hypothetical protein MHYP_G00329300 [Metynnis hypsauchen]
MIKELQNRGNVIRNLPPKDLPTPSVAESSQSPESMAPSESSEEYYQIHLEVELKKEKFKQEVDSVARFLYFMDPRQPSLTFVQDNKSFGNTASSCLTMDSPSKQFKIICIKRGPEAPSCGGTTPAVRCEVCGKGFRSTIAVSTHERHVYPDVRNAKRIREARMRRGSTRWTEQEVDLLKQSVEEFEGYPDVTFSVTERFPNRSYEVIRAKIRRLCDQAQTPPHGIAAEPAPIARLLSPRQSKAVHTGLGERLVQLAGTLIGPPGDAHTHVIGEWLRGADQIPTLVETAAQSLLAELGSRVVCHHLSRLVDGWWRGPRTQRRTTRARQLAFRQHQQLYVRDRPALAGQILDGRSSAHCLIPLENIECVFHEKWGEYVPYWGLGHFMVIDTTENEHFSKPITSREILNTLRSTRADTALGPDRIGKQALLNWDPLGLNLERILNTWWFTGVIPQYLNRCHTVLLPKCKDESLQANVHNWRPITIGSGLLKLYSCILNGRLA